MELVNAEIKSKKELAQRLLDGEIFYTPAGEIVRFAEGLCNPWAVGTAPMQSDWMDYAKLTRDPKWYEAITKPVPCRVWDGNIVRRSPGAYRKLTPRECMRLQTIPEHYIDRLLDSGGHSLVAGKFNPVKRLLRITPGVLAETGIYQIGDAKNEVINFGRSHYHPRDVVQIFTKPRNEWTIALMVFRKGMRLSVDHAQPNGKCVSELMTASVKQKHKELVARTDPDEIIRTGWLAIPRNEFISSVILTDIFEKLGAWNE